MLSTSSWLRLPEHERDQVLVELMRVVAITGERDGRMGVFPADHFAGRDPTLAKALALR